MTSPSGCFGRECRGKMETITVHLEKKIIDEIRDFQTINKIDDESEAIALLIAGGHRWYCKERRYIKITDLSNTISFDDEWKDYKEIDNA